MASSPITDPNDPRLRGNPNDTVIARPPKKSRMMKKYLLPDYCDVREFVVRELDANDEIEAAIWADKNLNSALRESAVAAIGAEQRESMRLALVSVDGQPVNVGGIPFLAMDDWSYRTVRFLQLAFNELNGVDTDDLKNFQAGAVVVTSAHGDSAPLPHTED